MPDEAFANPRLAAAYDAVEAERGDLEVYAAIVEELGGRRVLDVGCGTGTFALLLAERGFEVVGLDPAGASLDVARGKPGGGRVTWIEGDASALPPLEVDVATMTGNVAQMIGDDDDWQLTLRAVREALRPAGHLVFETRDPAFRAWEAWSPEETRQVVDIQGIGPVEQWYEVTRVELPLVGFRSMFVFPDGEELTSESTIRFREREEVESDLEAAGYALEDVRDAPDRPNRELVFIARREA